GRQPLPSSPFDYVRPEAPPVFAAHGELDALVPASQARALGARLREVSTSPVVYAELPGGPHNFDLFHSIRFEILIDGIEAFTAGVRSRPVPSNAIDGATSARTLARRAHPPRR